MLEGVMLLWEGPQSGGNGDVVIGGHVMMSMHM